MVTNVSFCALRLVGSAVKSQRKVAQKDGEASLEETVGLCVPG